MRQSLALGLCFFLLAGCDTTRVAPDDAQAISPSDVYAFSRPSSKDDARIVFVQDRGAMSCLGAGMSVYLDEKLAAETGSGQKVTLYHPPGPTQFSIKNNAKCAGGDLRGLLLDLKPGYSYQIRGYRGMWDKPEPMLTSPSPYKFTR